MRSNTASRHQKHPPPSTTVCKFSIKIGCLCLLKVPYPDEQLTHEQCRLTTPEHKTGSYLYTDENRKYEKTFCAPEPRALETAIVCSRTVRLCVSRALSRPRSGDDRADQ